MPTGEVHVTSPERLYSDIVTLNIPGGTVLATEARICVFFVFFLYYLNIAYLYWHWEPEDCLFNENPGLHAS